LRERPGSAATLTIDGRFSDAYPVGQAVNRLGLERTRSVQIAFELELAVAESVNKVIEHAMRSQNGCAR